jgi:hypothetical protein
VVFTQQDKLRLRKRPPQHLRARPLELAFFDADVGAVVLERVGKRLILRAGSGSEYRDAKGQDHRWYRHVHLAFSVGSSKSEARAAVTCRGYRNYTPVEERKFPGKFGVLLF